MAHGRPANRLTETSANTNLLAQANCNRAETINASISRVILNFANNIHIHLLDSIFIKRAVVNLLRVIMAAPPCECAARGSSSLLLICSLVWLPSVICCWLYVLLSLGSSCLPADQRLVAGRQFRLLNLAKNDNCATQLARSLFVLARLARLFGQCSAAILSPTSLARSFGTSRKPAEACTTV